MRSNASLLLSLLALAAVSACGGQGAVGNLAPRARLSAPLNAPMNETVLFDASSSFDPDGTVVEYTFSFSDDPQPVTQSTPEITHAFAQAGAYEVAVVVRDAQGLLARATQLVVVRADAPTCVASSDCSLGSECREHLCYAVGVGTGTGLADCKIDAECSAGSMCRAGLCLSIQDHAR
jgi:hypothetical protein